MDQLLTFLIDPFLLGPTEPATPQRKPSSLPGKWERGESNLKRRAQPGKRPQRRTETGDAEKEADRGKGGREERARGEKFGGINQSVLDRGINCLVSPTLPRVYEEQHRGPPFNRAISLSAARLQHHGLKRRSVLPAGGAGQSILRLETRKPSASAARPDRGPSKAKHSDYGLVVVFEGEVMLWGILRHFLEMGHW